MMGHSRDVPASLLRDLQLHGAAMLMTPPHMQNARPDMVMTDDDRLPWPDLLPDWIRQSAQSAWLHQWLCFPGVWCMQTRDAHQVSGWAIIEKNKDRLFLTQLGQDGWFLLDSSAGP